jgi:hypothetical protein
MVANVFEMVGLEFYSAYFPLSLVVMLHATDGGFGT